ncbi:MULTISPECIES: acyltransferase [Mycobacterium]|uniref:Acyltransferase n=1 Tax=Mycobacterium colombiense TaxID=339268 RepID=A0A329LY97_9MYCO|nr:MULTISPECIES: acyltransferase [Mycobacterium]MDM4141618.1 acyltransferase [Mycobacterium sp. FLAC0960]RAV12841.1 acyltransferase [Mycobacterium colombiense]
MKLGQVFDPRSNALNAWRLALAAEVIFWHTYPVRGHLPSLRAVLQLLLSVGVDGFFAISGFLITASWLSNPKLRAYLAARALRILPGFYVCMIVTAFVFAPLSVAIQGGSPAKLLFSFAPFEYVLKNIGVLWLKPDVGGTPHDIPNAGIWNASLWSLFWEIMCYLVVAAIGVAGLANRRWVSPVILVVAAIGASMMPPVTFPEVFNRPTGNMGIVLVFMACRAAIMFAAGALLYQWRDVIPARWWLVAVSVVIVLVAGQLPDYRVVAAVPLAYAVIVSGSLLHNRRLRLRTDLSYGMYIYAYPTQQLLAVLGLLSLNPIVFCLTVAVATLPLAAASWFLVEKPARSLKARLKRRSVGSREQAAMAMPPEVPGAV